MGSTRAAAIVIGLLTTHPALHLAHPAVPVSNSATITEGSTAESALRATKGVVTFVNAYRLVIMRSPQSGRRMTFVLNRATERAGIVRPGSTVDVRYRAEGKEQLATAVTVVANHPASAAGHQ